jgi:diguanylate cyclase (GGDEF)-like protein
MQFHIPTLFAVTTLVAATVGTLLAIAGLQSRSVRALTWLGVGYIFGAFGAALLSLRGVLPDVVTIQVANAVLFVGHGVLWSGTRVFAARPVRPVIALAGATIWVAACQIPAFYATVNLRVMLASLIVGTYVLAGAYELWRCRSEELRSSRIVVTLLVIHSAFYLVRVPLALVLPVPQDAQSLQSVWLAVLTMETILHVIAIGFVFFGLAKDRLELEQRIAATTDPLTGVLNRRGFLSRAEAELAADREAGHPTALLMFDIDHFKRINDCWGHEAGDRALVAFCQVAAAQLGPSALFGRIGGEEFACIIKGGDEGWARRAAERVRVALAAAPIDLGGPLLLPTTVSAGVASTAAGRSDMSALMAGADEALYRAKSLGRNRVEGSSRVPAEPRLRAA